MKKKYITMMTLVMGIFALFYIGMSLFHKDADSQDTKGQRIVALNEVEQLIQRGDTNLAQEKLEQLKRLESQQEVVEERNKGTGVVPIVSMGLMWGVFLYLWIAILRPFDRMKQYTEQLAQGNFDIPLEYERANYFGEFTWAFDHMRKEIIQARAGEKEAIENNKTVIATLSHDIKTPLASIRAYAEGLEANLDGSLEKRARYMSVIMRKCDEVAALTNDLFLHSMTNLDKLKVGKEEVEVCSFLQEVLEELSVEQHDIRYRKPAFSAEVLIDKKRFTQLMENLINNARKYAKSDIYVEVEKKEEMVELYIRDQGPGIPDEDIPFIFDKFYRGKNCGEEQGSGLGLYIVKYIVEKMNGDIQMRNYELGLEVVISLRIS